MLALADMTDLLDLDRYPIGRLDSREGEILVDRCKRLLDAEGMFNLEGFVRPEAVDRAVSEVWPRIDTEGYRHARRHNIYFQAHIPGLEDGHPALQQFETAHRTLCADQLTGTVIDLIYQWAPMLPFMARVMERPEMYLMSDPLASVNVVSYGPDEGLNWHFDRSQFTTTLLMRHAEAGGEFQYRSGLRSDDDPNYEGVAELVQGRDPRVTTNALAAGTLNVFAGKNTAHRVTPVQGSMSRLVAVFSYYDSMGVTFSDSERLGFYGRVEAHGFEPNRVSL
jgi:hypothetical protein